MTVEYATPNPGRAEAIRGADSDGVRSAFAARVLLLLALAHIFGSFQGSPLQPYVWRYDFLVALGLLAFAALYAGTRVLNDGIRLNGLELSVLVVAAVLPLYSGWRAAAVFGQPLLYGVLAERNMLMGLYGLAAAYVLKRGHLRLGDVEWAMVRLCWLSVAAFYLVTMARAAGWQPAPILEGSEVRFGKDNFNIVVLAFGACYYFVSVLRRAGGGWALLLLLVTIVLVRESRSDTAALGVGFAAYLASGATWRQRRRALWLLVGGGVAAAVVIGAVPGVAGRVGALVGLFGAAGAAVAGESSGDVSASVRLVEFAQAWPQIVEHLALGNGKVSAQWMGGFERLFGYFHPSDIGIFGVVFLYGLVGMALFGTQIVFAYRASRRLENRQASVFIVSLKVFLLYLYVLSLMTGVVIIVSVAMTLVVLALLVEAGRRLEGRPGAPAR